MRSARQSRAWRSRTAHIREKYRHFCDEESRYKCWYCGQRSDTIDHCPSIEVAYNFGVDQIERAGIKFLLIPACRECNGLLGDVPLFEPESRGHFIHEKIHKRYKKLLNCKKFDQDELRQFGPSLKKYLKNANLFIEWINRRLYISGRFEVCDLALLELRKGNKEPENQQEQPKNTEVLQP